MSIEPQQCNSDVLDFEPVFSRDNIPELEGAARDWGVTRRVAFILATMNRVELADVARKLADDDAEALFDMIKSIEGLIKYHQELGALFKSVEARIFIAAHDAFDIPLKDEPTT